MEQFTKLYETDSSTDKNYDPCQRHTTFLSLKETNEEKDFVTYEKVTELRPTRKTITPRELDVFTKSLSVHGFRDPLITDEKGRIIDGNKRYFASVSLGLIYLPCLSHRFSHIPSYNEIVAQILSPATHYFTKAKLISILADKHLLTQEAIGELIGTSQSYVANKLRLLNFTPNQIKLITEARLSERHARALLRIKNTELRTLAACHVRDTGMNVSATDEYIESLLKDSDLVPEEKETSKKLRAACNAVDKLSTAANDLGVLLKINRDEDAKAINYTIKIYK